MFGPNLSSINLTHYQEHAMLSPISSATAPASSTAQPAAEGGLLNIPSALDAFMPSPPPPGGGGSMLAELFDPPNLDSLPFPGGLTNVANDPGPEGRDRVREQIKNLMDALRG